MFYQAYRLILDKGDGWDRFLQDISEAGIESAEKQTAREVTVGSTYVCTQSAIAGEALESFSEFIQCLCFFQVSSRMLAHPQLLFATMLRVCVRRHSYSGVSI